MPPPRTTTPRGRAPGGARPPPLPTRTAGGRFGRGRRVPKLPGTLPVVGGELLTSVSGIRYKTEERARRRAQDASHAVAEPGLPLFSHTRGGGKDERGPDRMDRLGRWARRGDEARCRFGGLREVDVRRRRRFDRRMRARAGDRRRHRRRADRERARRDRRHRDRRGDHASRGARLDHRELRGERGHGLRRVDEPELVGASDTA